MNTGDTPLVTAEVGTVAAIAAVAVKVARLAVAQVLVDTSAGSVEIGAAAYGVGLVAGSSIEPTAVGRATQRPAQIQVIIHAVAVAQSNARLPSQLRPVA